MKLTKILLSTLTAASLAVAFSACSTTANNTVANNANKANTIIITNSPTPANSITPTVNPTPPANANKTSPAKSPSGNTDARKITGELQKGETESLILYVGAETGDYAAYCFQNTSDAGRAILAACRHKEQCEVTGETESGSCKVPGLEADLSDSGRIVKVSAAKSLGGKK